MYSACVWFSLLMGMIGVEIAYYTTPADKRSPELRTLNAFCFAILASLQIWVLKGSIP